MTVTKLDLTRHLSDTVGLSATDSKLVVEAIFDTIRTTLASGEDVKLSGFGNFVLLHKNARPGRNPRNMDPVEISARRVVTYRSSQIVRENAYWADSENNTIVTCENPSSVRKVEEQGLQAQGPCNGY
ncbi:integration host factor subunit alpha [Acidithiobacillus ferridurans]|uniref:integration host factor subunit alpha n=1 Tax=Acidithiobacillus ferridurans TaxID=1232575 RepID=UPI0026A210E2